MCLQPFMQPTLAAPAGQTGECILFCFCFCTWDSFLKPEDPPIFLCSQWSSCGKHNQQLLVTIWIQRSHTTKVNSVSVTFFSHRELWRGERWPQWGGAAQPHASAAWPGPGWRSLCALPPWRNLLTINQQQQQKCNSSKQQQIQVMWRLRGWKLQLPWSLGLDISTAQRSL